MSLPLPNSYPLLHFHQVHGDNICLLKNRTVASRNKGFSKGIVFSDRPIMIGEPVYMKFLEVSPSWSGALRIGFTMNDPLSLSSKLPEYVCPDLISMHGNWAKAVSEKNAGTGSILYFYVDQIGNVHYGNSVEEFGIFFGGVNTSGKIWAVLDIYGSTLKVEFIDPSILNQDFRNGSQCNSTQKIKPLSFHSVHGKNVTLEKHSSVVYRKSGLHSLAYVFTELPVEIGKTILMKVLQTDQYFEGPFVYGITSCDPQNILPLTLPDDVDDLLDRPEYWVVRQNSYSFQIGDIIKFMVSCQGQVEMTVNEELESVFYVDHSLPLWFFINLSNSISKLELNGTLCHSNSIEELNEAFSNMKTREYCNNEVMPGSSSEQSTNECVVCYEEPVDCALYRCGHMCMCFKCALKLFNSGPNGVCPICRSSITDVIKVYK